MPESTADPPPLVTDFFRAERRPLAAGETLALRKLGEVARVRLEPEAYRIDRERRPRLDAAGSPETPTELVLAPEHVQIRNELFATGVAVGPLSGRHDWPFTFALIHEVAEVGLLCSATVTLATAYSLAKHGSSELRGRFLADLLADDGRAQGATWATERQGGSDVGANRSSARPSGPDRWSLTGEKFFCSNVGASCAVVTARPDGAPDGIRGIRLFFVPARASDGRPNWRVTRLKEKLGTVTVPTGEVVFENAEAYALGSPEAGPLPLMEMLNVSRVANAVGSAAALQRAAEVARERARVRVAFGRALEAHPLLARDLATLTVEADAASLLALDAAFRFGATAGERPPYSDDYYRMRLTTHAAKMITAEQAVRGGALAMEVFGGEGYLEELPVAKLLRDALVTPIWEGGANIQALDARETVQRYRATDGWRTEAGREAGSSVSAEVRRFLSVRLTQLDASSQEIDAKELLRLWGELRQMTLLARWARTAPEPGIPEARAEFFALERSARTLGRVPVELVGQCLGR